MRVDNNVLVLINVGDLFSSMQGKIWGGAMGAARAGYGGFSRNRPAGAERCIDCGGSWRFEEV